MEVTLSVTSPLPALLVCEWHGPKRLKTKQKVIDKNPRTPARGFGNLLGRGDKFGVRNAQASKT